MAHFLTGGNILVLAYPCAHEEEKRHEFMEAMISANVKALIKRDKTSRWFHHRKY